MTSPSENQQPLGMLQDGRIPMNDEENAAVDALIEAHSGEPVSLTRRDPGETGPVVAHVGAQVFLIASDGTTEEA